MNRCDECKYWSGLGTKDGRCKRMPPAVRDTLGRMWPITSPDDWCGEFKEKLKDE